MRGVIKLIIMIFRYFLTNISRISAPTFLPESKDILQIRVMTTGVIEYNFDMDGRECIMVGDTIFLA